MAKTKKDLLTIEDIMVALKKKAKYIANIEKVDGITMECSLAESKKAEDRLDEVKELCKELKNTPVAIELNEAKENVFLVQFPEMIPEYTDEQIEKMFIDTFKWLIDNFLTNSKNINFTKEQFALEKNMFVKHAIIIYYRSNVNQYKQKPEDYLNNLDFRNKIDNIYLDYLSHV